MPQGRHAHALLPHGQACLDRLPPGFCGAPAGVRMLPGADGSAEMTLSADLVVAATGRAPGSPPGWRGSAIRGRRRTGWPST